MHRLLCTHLWVVAEFAATSGEIKGSVTEIEVDPVRAWKPVAGP